MSDKFLMDIYCRKDTFRCHQIDGKKWMSERGLSLVLSVNPIDSIRTPATSLRVSTFSSLFVQSGD